MSDVLPQLTPDEAAALKAHLDFANSERAAIWARNSVMIVTNGLLVTATNIAPSNIRSTGCALAGVVTCFLWWRMTNAGWQISYHHNMAGKAIWGDRIHSPFENRNIGQQGFTDKPQRDVIRHSTMILIIMFGLLHAFFVACPFFPEIN